MSSTLKAAVIAAAIFVVIVLAFVFLRKPRPELERGGEVSSAPASEPEKVVEPAPPSRPIERVSRETVKLTVEVLDKALHRRLNASTVAVFEAGEGDRAGARVWESDGKTGNGLFEIPLKDGAYVVRASCARYKGERRSVTLLPSVPQTVVVELERGNSISGRVLSRSGQPIGDARVLALEELSSPDADLEENLIRMIDIPNITGKVAAEDTSAADGSYQLDGLELRYYTVRAVAQGYGPGKVEQVPAPRDQVDIVLDKGLQISGTVVDSAGGAVADARVQAFQEIESQSVFDIIMNKARPPVDQATTDASGGFQLSTLGPGIYSFLVEAKGFQATRVMKKRVVDQGTLSFTLKPGLSIVGIVRGPADEPVSGAKVRANPMGARQGPPDILDISFEDGSVSTDDQGVFIFDTLEDGPYMLLCSHDDYQTLQRRDVRPSSEEVTLKMSLGGRVRGRVTDGATGSPLAGVRLQANDVADLHKDAVTQEDGTFMLTGLSAGSRPVSVTVSLKGYARSRKDIKVTENAEVEENFALEATGIVTGVVLNGVGDPVRGARVMAKRAQESSSVEQTLANDLTDAQGKFELQGIESGEDTWIRVKKSEYLDGVSERFAIEAGSAVEVPPVVLAQGGAVGGRVTGPSGQPIPGASVTVKFEGDTEISLGMNPSNSTNSNGEYVILGLHSGTVDLIVRPVHLLEKTVKGVQVIEGQRSVVNIELEEGGSVAGRVVDASGNPVQNAEIEARDYGAGAKLLRSATDSDGHFLVEGITASDTIELAASHEEYGSWSQESVPVGTKDVEIVLKGLSMLRGEVVTSEGTPVEAFTIHPQPTGDVSGAKRQLKPQTFNPSDGIFEYRGVPSGVYTIYVRSPQYAAATVASVRVLDGSAIDLGRIVLQMGGVVRGRVIDASTQKPVAGAKVQITQGASRFARNDSAASAGGAGGANPLQTTDSNGNFRYSGLKGGSLSLKITHPDYVTAKLEDVNPDIVEKSQDLVVELDVGGEIQGVVVDKAGKARSAMPVYLIGSDPNANQSASSDREGKFHFSGVPSGTYTVKAHRFPQPGQGVAEQAEVSVEVENGQAYDATLQLE